MMTSFLVKNVCCVNRMYVVCIFKINLNLFWNQNYSLWMTLGHLTHTYLLCHNKCKAQPRTCSLSHEMLQFVWATGILPYRTDCVKTAMPWIVNSDAQLNYKLFLKFSSVPGPWNSKRCMFTFSVETSFCVILSDTLHKIRKAETFVYFCSK